MLQENTDYSTKTLDELYMLIDEARDKENYVYAQHIIEFAIQQTIKMNASMRFLLPRATANLRDIGKPYHAIALAKEWEEKQGKEVLSAALFTSMGAAWCDIGIAENNPYRIKAAWYYARRACAMLGGKCDEKLSKLFQRLHSLGEYDRR